MDIWWCAQFYRVSLNTANVSIILNALHHQPSFYHISSVCRDHLHSEGQWLLEQWTAWRQLQHVSQLRYKYIPRGNTKMAFHCSMLAIQMNTCCAIVFPYSISPYIVSSPSITQCLQPMTHVWGYPIFGHPSLKNLLASKLESAFGIGCTQVGYRNLWLSNLPSLSPLLPICTLCILGLPL